MVNHLKWLQIINHKDLIEKIAFGKATRSATYLETSSIPRHETQLLRLIRNVKDITGEKIKFNVLKIHKKTNQLSCLSYPNFFLKPHPALRYSICINLNKFTLRFLNYENSPNYPILHRKETLLHPSHPLISKFKALTDAEEAEGLYNNPRTIGFKNNWEQLLQRKGLGYKGHKLIRISHRKEIYNDNYVEVKRHKTAIKRYNFSKPIQTIQENNLLNANTSFFDFGCGKGDDVSALKKLGFNASGWDPVFKPSEFKIRSDIVNLVPEA